MRGIGRTLSRLPAAPALCRVLLLGAAFLAAPAAVKADTPSEPGEDMAWAVPRPLLRGGDGGALPQPLAPADAARLRRIFALQARGEIAEATRLSQALDPDDALVQSIAGHVVAERLLGPHTRASAEALQAWLARWPDLPDAPAIHALLRRRIAPGSALPPLVQAPAPPVSPAVAPAALVDPAGLALLRRPELDRPDLVRAVREAARAGRMAGLRTLLATPGLPPGSAAQLRGEAGQILFLLNRDRDALDIAAPGAAPCPAEPARPCATAAAAGYAAGLAAWRLGLPEEARDQFERAWEADLATPAQRAAAAFWAARAHLRLGAEEAHGVWLARAAGPGLGLHALLARHMLGLALEGDTLPRETLGEADGAAVAATPAGLRALALLQLGQRDRAEAELRLLWREATQLPGFARALMLVADQARLPTLAAQFAELAEAADGRPRTRLRAAVPRLRPAGGFTANSALVLAIARVESNFDPAAVSPAGARGLMQIMPATARFLAGLPEDSDQLPALHDPAVNLRLGQRYINYLAATDIVAGDKLRLLASYNAGQGAFARWGAAIRDQGDPLLFLEAIPLDETRAFVQRVLAFTWLYADRLGLPARSLDELAAGAWPRYEWRQTAAATLN